MHKFYRPKNLIVLTGPSGTGKSTLADMMETEHDLLQLVSYTTRLCRGSEDRHVFVTVPTFLHMATDGLFAATSVYDGNWYGATYDAVALCDVFVCDPAGISELQVNRVPHIVIALDAAEETRMARMEGRGDSEEQIKKRIEHDRHAFPTDWHSLLPDSFRIDTDALTQREILAEAMNYVQSGKERT